MIISISTYYFYRLNKQNKQNKQNNKMAPQKKNPCKRIGMKYTKRTPVVPFENPYKREYKNDLPYGYLKLPDYVKFDKKEIVENIENVEIPKIDASPLVTDFDELVSKENNFSLNQFPDVGRNTYWMCPSIAVQQAIIDIKNVEQVLNNPERFDLFLDCMMIMAHKSASVAKISVEYFK